MGTPWDIYWTHGVFWEFLRLIGTPGDSLRFLGTSADSFETSGGILRTPRDSWVHSWSSWCLVGIPWVFCGHLGFPWVTLRLLATFLGLVGSLVDSLELLWTPGNSLDFRKFFGTTGTFWDSLGRS